jgi:hypothetical protein
MPRQKPAGPDRLRVAMSRVEETETEERFGNARDVLSELFRQYPDIAQTAVTLGQEALAKRGMLPTLPATAIDTPEIDLAAEANEIIAAVSDLLPREPAPVRRGSPAPVYRERSTPDAQSLMAGLLVGTGEKYLDDGMVAAGERLALQAQGLNPPPPAPVPAETKAILDEILGPEGPRRPFMRLSAARKANIQALADETNPNREPDTWRGDQPSPSPAEMAAERARKAGGESPPVEPRPTKRQARRAKGKRR